MDGENNGKPYEQMDDLGVPFFLETPKLQHEKYQLKHKNSPQSHICNKQILPKLGGSTSKYRVPAEFGGKLWMSNLQVVTKL